MCHLVLFFLFSQEKKVEASHLKKGFYRVYISLSDTKYCQGVKGAVIMSLADCGTSAQLCDTLTGTCLIPFRSFSLLATLYMNANYQHKG